MTKRIRIIKIDLDYELRTKRSYKDFKKDFPDFVYDRKENTYTLPRRILKEVKFIPKESVEQEIFLIKEPVKRKLKEKDVAVSPELKEKTRFFRESVVLSAHYKDEHFFDWRVSMINSQKIDTKAYLQKVLMNKWERFSSAGERNLNWTFVIEAEESEYISSFEAQDKPMDKIIKEGF